MNKALMAVAFIIGVAALVGLGRAATRPKIEEPGYEEGDDGVQPWDLYEVRLWTTGPNTR